MEFLERVGIPMNPARSWLVDIGDLDDHQISTLAHKWAKIVAEHYGRTL
jgi:hypothetical protein